MHLNWRSATQPDPHMKARAAKLRLAQSETERTSCFAFQHDAEPRQIVDAPSTHHSRTAHSRRLFRALLRSFLVLARKGYAFAKLTSFRRTMLSYPLGSALDEG